jgi:hypothetical protein
MILLLHCVLRLLQTWRMAKPTRRPRKLIDVYPDKILRLEAIRVAARKRNKRVPSLPELLDRLITYGMQHVDAWWGL